MSRFEVLIKHGVQLFSSTYFSKCNLWISSWGQKWFWQRPLSPKARKHPPVLPEWPSRYSLRFEFQLLYSKLSMNLIKNLHITQIMQGLKIGLNWTGIWVSQPDRTGHPNLPDSSCQTESRLIFLKFYLTIIGYLFSYDKVPGHKFGVKKSQLGYMWKYTKKQTKNWKQQQQKRCFSSIFKTVKSPASGKKNIRILKICWTSGQDAMSGRFLVGFFIDKLQGRYISPHCEMENLANHAGILS